MPTTPFYLQQFRFLDGSPASGGKLYATVQGTETPAQLYLNPSLTTPAAQPLILSADGIVPQFWAPSVPGLCFKLKDPRAGLDTLVWTRDYISDGDGVNAPGTVTSVGLSLGTAMDAIADVSSSPVVTTGNLGLELADQTQGKALMSPLDGTGKPAFRQIEQSDISGGPFLPIAGGTLDGVVNGPTGRFDNLVKRNYPVGGSDLRNATFNTDGEVVSGFETISAGGDRYRKSVLTGYIEELFEGNNFGYGWRLKYNAVGDYEVFAGPVAGSLPKVFSVSQGGDLFGLGGLSLGSAPTERITALGAGFLTSLAISGLTSGALPRATAGGLLADSCFGDDGANARCTRQLTLNGVVRPEWAIGATVLDSLSSVWQSIGKNFRFGRNVYYASDAQFKAIESAIGTNFPSILSQMVDGSLNYATSTADPVAGSTVSMTTKFQVGKEGGVGTFGVTPPATRPTISGGRGTSATLQALYQALGATGLILDSTTATSVTREASVTPMTLSGAPGTPAIVNCVDANMPAYGFSGGGGSAESLQWAIDFDHNRIAEEPAIVHVHWLPNTTGAGDVGFKLYYQWTEAGAVWQPATLFPTVAVAAGGVQWADKRTDFSIPGTGKSYNSRLLVRLIRDSSDPLDTYAGHAVLAAVGCHYQADPGQA